MSGSGPYTVASSIKDDGAVEQGTTSHSHVAGTKQSAVNHIIRSAALALMRASVTVNDLGASGTITFVPVEPGPGLTLDPPYTIPWTRASGVISYDVDDNSGTIGSGSVTFQATDAGGDALNTLREIAREVVSASFIVDDMSDDTLSIGVGDYGDDTLDAPYTCEITVTGAGPYNVAYVIKNGSASTIDSGNDDYTAGTEARLVYEDLLVIGRAAVDAENAVSDLSASISVTRNSTDNVLDMGFDKYNGMLRCPSPNGGTGFFRLEKRASDNRWLFVSPLGNYLWLTSIQNCRSVPTAIRDSRYSGDDDNFYAHRNKMMMAWGINALGEYSSTYGMPFGVWGGSDYTIPQIPTALFINTLINSMRGTLYDRAYAANLDQPVKDVISGVPVATYGGWRGSPLVDAYDDTRLQAASRNCFYYWQGDTRSQTGAWRRQTSNPDAGVIGNPWCTVITLDDADYLFGFKGAGDGDVNTYPHPVFLVACTKPEYGADEYPSGFAGPWSDAELYAKTAWSDWLQTQYATIGDLNTAWATSSYYTTFGTTGTFGTGTGILDEDGRHAWCGTDPYMLSDANANFRADCDLFLREFSRTYVENVYQPIKDVDPDHLIAGPDAIQNYGEPTRENIIKGMDDAGLIDVWILNYDRDDTGSETYRRSMVANKQVYDWTGKPCYLSGGLSAQADSPKSAYDPKIADFPTQEDRGQGWIDFVEAVFAAQATNGDYYCVGFNHWELHDNSGEGYNYGFISDPEGNPYDGVHCVTGSPVDAWGYTMGGELANYGDFLTSVTDSLNWVRSQM
jgi:hypothetical protein